MTVDIQKKLQMSSFKNKTHNGKFICPICGEKIQKISKKNRFINSPAGIYLIFSSNRCKLKFVGLMNQDNSEWNIKKIIDGSFY